MKNKTIKGLLVAGMLVFLTACGTTNTDNNNNNNNTNTGENQQANTNTGITNEQTVEGIKIEKTSLVYENGTSTLTTQITNTGKTAKYVKSFNVTFKDKDGNVIIKLGEGTEFAPQYVGQTLEPGASTTLSFGVSQSLMDATTIEYSLNE